MSTAGKTTSRTRQPPPRGAPTLAGVISQSEGTADRSLLASPADDEVVQLSVRRAAASDRAALSSMFGRCTPSTRYRRFHGPVKSIPERYLADALSGSAFHYALVAWHDAAGFPDGDPVTGQDPAAGSGASPRASPGVAVALASCRVVEEGAAELGLLIEDAWQRHGLGTRLLRDLVAHASHAGVRVLQAQLLAEQAWIAGLLRPYGACRVHSAGNGVLNVTLRLAPQDRRPSETVDR
jgi:GNAT superfamily N-acetyltransferase